jgi:predicted ATPase
MSVNFSGIRLENFRAFSQSSFVPLRPITLLYGQNSAGKSSVIKSLLMLQQSILNAQSTLTRSDRGLILSGESVDLGSFATTVSNHEVSRKISVGVDLPINDLIRRANSATISWVLTADPTRFSVVMIVGELTLQFHRRELEGRKYFVLDRESVPAWCDLVSGDDLFSSTDPVLDELRLLVGYVPVFDGALVPRRFVATVLSGGGGDVPPAKGVSLNFVPQPDQTLSDDSRPLSRGGSAANVWWGVSQSVIRALEKRFHSLSYVGPLRREPQRFERYVPTVDRHVGSSGEQMLSLMYENPSLVLQMNNYLGMMDLPYSVKVQKMGAQEAVGSVIYLSLINKKTNLEVSPSDVGVGYSQVLPLIAQAVLSQDSLVCIEQPELHLHPAMQARLGDMFINQVLLGSNLQFLIETHSESLMLRILRRIRESKGITPEHVQVLYVDQPQSGQSIIHELEIHESGDFVTPWPHGFFDERLEEFGL